LKNEDNEMEMPSLRNIMALRKHNDKINEAYVFFCEKFLKHVVGVQSFNRACKRHVFISEIATFSDKALALLMLENSEFRWTAEFAKIEQGEKVAKDDKQLPKPLYTSTQGDRKGFTKKYGGWSERGIERFNALYKMVREDRSRNGKWFDTIMSGRIRSQRGGDEEEEAFAAGAMIVVADNDLFGQNAVAQGDDDDGSEVGEQEDI
jgi:hypothetical protein